MRTGDAEPRRRVRMAPKNMGGARGHHQRLAGVPLAVATLALHLDDLELHTIRPLKEADPPTIARDHLL